MLTVILVLVVAAFIAAVVAAAGKAPIWISVILLCIVELLRVIPVGK